MTTYASPRVTRVAVISLISLLFLAGIYMFAVGVFHAINTISKNARSESAAKKGVLPSTALAPNTVNLDGVSENEINENEHNRFPRFPSTTAPSVELIFGAVTLGHGAFGIVAVTLERANLLATEALLLVISCFVKLLFLFASVGMHSLTPDHPFLTSVTVLGILSATIELILVMCVCQFTKLVKRGDAARQEIQSIHSYHLERRSRSRSQSQSRMRSFYTVSTDRIYRPNSYVSASQTPAQSRPVSRSGSFQDLSIMTESASYYVPPPIFLKLDR